MTCGVFLADGIGPRTQINKKEKGKPRGRPFQRKGAACVAAACQNADQNMSPQRMSVCASPEVVYEAVPADDAMPDGLEVEVVVAAC